MNPAQPASTPTHPDLAPPLRDARHAAHLGRFAVGEETPGVAVVMLDDERWPIGVFTITGSSGRKVVLTAAEFLASLAVDSERLARAVIIDCRADGDCHPDDLDTLLEASALLDQLGVCLIELIVVTAAMYVPIGAASGLASRW